MAGEKCKAWSRHRMDELGGPPLSYSVDVSPNEIATWFRCTECHVVRCVVVSEISGAITYSRYFGYPPGYRWEGGGDAPTKAELRLGYLRKREGRAMAGIVTPLRRSS